MQSTAESCSQTIDWCNDLNYSCHVSVTQHTFLAWSVFTNKISLPASQYRTVEMCEIEMFRLFFRGRVFLFSGVNLQERNLSRLYFLERSLKRWWDDMKVSFLLSDFNFLSAESVLLRRQILFHARSSKLIFTFHCRRGRAIFWDGSCMQNPNCLDWLQPGFNNSNQANAVFSSTPRKVINHFPLHNCVKFPAKLVFILLFLRSTSIWFVICDLYWCDTLQGFLHPTPQLQHIPHLPSSEPTCQIWAIPGHLVAFAPAEPRPTALPRGASLTAQAEIWLSISIWHPRTWGGGGVKSSTLWQKDLGLKAHKQASQTP